jgi:VanZ family protein
MKFLLALYTLVIILASVLPINGPHSGLNDNYIVNIRLDYLMHAGIYVPWIILIWLAMGKALRSSAVKIMGAVLFTLLFAAATEGIQYWLPYRAYNINDLLSNWIGVVLGYVIVIGYLLSVKRC